MSGERHLLVRALNQTGEQAWRVACSVEATLALERQGGLTKVEAEVTCEDCRRCVVGGSLRALGSGPDLGPVLCQIPKGGAFVREVVISPKQIAKSVARVYLGIEDATSLIGEAALDGAARMTLPLNLYLQEEARIYVTFEPAQGGPDALINVVTLT